MISWFHLVANHGFVYKLASVACKLIQLIMNFATKFATVCDYRNFDCASELLKFRTFFDFRQVVLSAKCVFDKISVRKVPFGKRSGHPLIPKSIIFFEISINSMSFTPNKMPSLRPQFRFITYIEMSGQIKCSFMSGPHSWR